MANLMITCPLCGKPMPYCNVQGRNLKYGMSIGMACEDCPYQIECHEHKNNCHCNDWLTMYSEWVRTLQENIELESIISEQQYEINKLKDVLIKYK